MRKKAKQRQQALQGELHDVRLSVAKEMGQAYKKGDMNSCIKGIKDKEMRNNYCIVNFSDDYSKLQICREGEDFNKICCDFEFGDFYANERSQCYESSKNQSSKNESDNGRWIWQHSIV